MIEVAVALDRDRYLPSDLLLATIVISNGVPEQGLNASSRASSRRTSAAGLNGGVTSPTRSISGAAAGAAAASTQTTTSAASPQRQGHVRRTSLAELSDMTLADPDTTPGPAQSSPNLGHNSSPRRRRSSRPRESIMMACAHILGTFSVDPHRVRTAPLQALREKGFSAEIEGGGVVSRRPMTASDYMLDSLKRSRAAVANAVAGSVGANNGGGAGGTNPPVQYHSSFADAQQRASAPGAALPVLSTVQSLLAIELSLEAGEQRTFQYRIRLPASLPPSHRGRCFRTVYTLNVVLQYPDRSYRTIETPVRIAGSLTDLHTPYDVFQPHVWTRDVAEVWEGSPRPAKRQRSEEKEKRRLLRYVARLRAQRRADGAGANDDHSRPNVLDQADVQNGTTADQSSESSDSDEDEETIQRPFAARVRAAGESASFAGSSGGERWFDLKDESGAVGRLLVDRTLVYAGEMLFCKFEIQSRRCLRLDAAVCSRELLDASIARDVRDTAAGAHTGAGGGSGSSGNSSGTGSIGRRQLCQATVPLRHFREAAFSLAIPNLTAPSFATSLFAVEHCLHLRITLALPLERKDEDECEQADAAEKEEEARASVSDDGGRNAQHDGEDTTPTNEVQVEQEKGNARSTPANGDSGSGGDDQSDAAQKLAADVTRKRIARERLEDAEIGRSLGDVVRVSRHGTTTFYRSDHLLDGRSTHLPMSASASASASIPMAILECDIPLRILPRI